MKPIIGYIRVSTNQQGKSGLGIEAQREALARFAPAAAQQVRETLFHSDQKEEELEDGSIVIRFKAAGHLEMAWYLYQWGDKVDVIKPEPLKRLIADHRRSDFPVLP